MIKHYYYQKANAFIKMCSGQHYKIKIYQRAKAKQLLGAISKTINWSVINIAVDKKYCSSITFM